MIHSAAGTPPRLFASGYDAGQAARALEARPSPLPLEEITLRHVTAADHHSIDEVVEAPDGRRFVIADSFDTSRDRGQAPGGYLEAFDAEGARQWRFQPEGGYKVKAVAVTPDRIYVSCEGEDVWDRGQLIALDPQGHRVWDFEAPDRTRAFGSLQVAQDGTVYTKADDQITALGQDGNKKWSKKLSIHSSDYFHLVYPDGSQIFANDNFSNNFGYDYFRKLSPDGRESEVDLPDIGTFPLELGTLVVYGGEHGEVHGFDRATGQTWQLETDAERGHKTPWLGQDGNIYLEARYDHRFYSLSPDGKLRWQREISDAAPSGMKDQPYQVDARGTFYYEHEEGGIQQIRPDGTPGERISVPGGIRSFAVSPGGKLFIHDYDDRILIHDPEQRTSYPFQVELDNPQVWELHRADDTGRVELRTNYEVLELMLSRDEQVRRILEQAQVPEPPAPTIRKQGRWVVIGGVRVPVRE
ncbi:MAG: PQQ-binding-like beta-propeller repeat protein [Armatimonadetes bacterium]|nr:PQQ-binding-like beta-propeller repeat protein [Armatimonadota bacterium]